MKKRATEIQPSASSPPQLTCGACKKTVFSTSNRLSFLACGIHVFCGACTGNKCNTCICDACELPLSEHPVVSPNCGCLYHPECDPGPGKAFDRCAWCSNNQKSRHGWTQIYTRWWGSWLHPHVRVPTLSKRKLEKHGWEGKDLAVLARYNYLSVLKSDLEMADLLRFKISMENLSELDFSANDVLLRFYRPHKKDFPVKEFLHAFPEVELGALVGCIQSDLSTGSKSLSLPQYLHQLGLTKEDMQTFLNNGSDLEAYSTKDEWRKAFRFLHI